MMKAEAMRIVEEVRVVCRKAEVTRKASVVCRKAELAREK